MDANALRGKRLLVVDDDEPSRNLMRAILTSAGASVDEASNGEEAVAAYDREHHDAVLMDIQMPLLDGMEATRIIRAKETQGDAPHTIIIAVTAHAMAEHRQRCLDAGMEAVMTKPIEPLSIVDEVAELLAPDK
jgi:CheY-like chemotaxis protein